MKMIRRRKTHMLKLEIISEVVARSSIITSIFNNGNNERDSMGSPSMRTSPFFVLSTRHGA
jgi:hypothetical protein